MKIINLKIFVLEGRLGGEIKVSRMGMLVECKR